MKEKEGKTRVNGNNDVFLVRCILCFSMLEERVVETKKTGSAK
jgi:hypothetical protein